MDGWLDGWMTLSLATNELTHVPILLPDKPAGRPDRIPLPILVPISVHPCASVVPLEARAGVAIREDPV